MSRKKKTKPLLKKKGVTKKRVTKKRSPEKEIAYLKNELENAHETLRAIQSGEIDALVVSGDEGERIFTLKSADLPYRILVETMSEGTATITTDGTIIYCNHRFAEMLKAEIEIVIGSDVRAHLSPPFLPTFDGEFRNASASRVRCSVDLCSSAGDRLPVILSMNPLQLESGVGVCLIATDLTEQKRFEEARADVDRLNVERDLRERFVATLSHDLRNPLAAAKMNAQMIVRYPEQHERHQILGNRIIHSVERADKMIQDLLDANRIRAGEKLPLEIGECDLKQTTEDTLAELSTVVGDRFVLDADDRIIGHWSCEQLRRVVENLAMNAVKYGDADAPVKVELRKDNRHVLIRVKNQGEPIPLSEQEKLFDPYFRVTNGSNTGQKGWGLGLTLVRGVAEAHGGSVKLESTKGKGTTFTVTLPHDARQKAQ